MMTDSSTTFFNGINYYCCKSCIIAEAKKLENKSLFADAFQLLHDAELYYSQITKELENEKKALFSRLNENERSHIETMQPSRTVCQNKNSSVNSRYHPPLNVICGKQKILGGLLERNPKDEFFCPVAVFENTMDPRQKPMYPKHLVYKDGKDVQLEEIRAAIYWERLKKQGAQISNHLKPEQSVLNQGNEAPSSESENSGIEKIRTPPNEEIEKPPQDTCSENLADFPLRSEINKTHDAINQRKPEVVTLMANNCRSPLHKYNSNIPKLKTAGKEIKNPSNQTEMIENRVTPCQKSRITVPNNITNLTKPKENASHNNLHHKIQSFQEISTNKKRSTQTNFSKADNTFIKEQKSCVGEAVKEDTCMRLESNERNATHAKTDAKFSNATFICDTVQKTTSILQETYLIQNGQKLTVPNSESLSNEIPKIPQRSNYLDDISKLFEESMVNSAVKEQGTGKAVPVNNKDKENVLPIHMIPPPWDEGEEDNTCTTKAFAVTLPSSTPLKRKSQFFSSGLFVEPKCSIGPRPSIASTTLNLSMIPETSRERSNSSSSAGSAASAANSKNLIHDKPMLSAIAETEEKANSLRSNYDISDPFNPELLNNLLERLQFPCEHHQNGYHISKTDIPAIKLSNSYKLGSKKYTIPAEIGKGNYARILKAYPTNQPREPVALKIQKPACVWEYYISKEIMNRLKSEEKLQYFLHYTEIFVFGNCSILLSEWGPYGSLLDFRNAWKATNRGSQDKYPMAVSVYLSIQIISAVHYLHSCGIIHGDIKPDNFIISSISSDGKPNIKLIDFGRSIDMTLFPKNTVFYIVIKTEDFTCNEMRDGRPWTYQTDLFGLAGTFYVLLIGEYMKTIKKSDGLWVLKKPLARYLCREQWDPIFMTLLNVPSCNELPDLAVLKTQLEKFYDSFSAFEKKQQFNKMLPIFKNLKL